MRPCRGCHPPVLSLSEANYQLPPECGWRKTERFKRLCWYVQQHHSECVCMCVCLNFILWSIIDFFSSFMKSTFSTWAILFDFCSLASTCDINFHSESHHMLVVFGKWKHVDWRGRTDACSDIIEYFHFLWVFEMMDEIQALYRMLFFTAYDRTFLELSVKSCWKLFRIIHNYRKKSMMHIVSSTKSSGRCLALNWCPRIIQSI